MFYVSDVFVSQFFFYLMGDEHMLGIVVHYHIFNILDDIIGETNQKMASTVNDNHQSQPASVSPAGSMVKPSLSLA